MVNEGNSSDWLKYTQGNVESCDNWQSDGLENRCSEMDSGFESLALRQPLMASFQTICYWLKFLSLFINLSNDEMAM